MRKASKFRLALMSTMVVLLLVAGPVAAFEVQFSGSNATGILDLDVNGTLYDVTFPFDTATNVYGSPIGTFLFDEFEAIDAIDAVNTALNTESAVTTVGSDTSRSYNIGYDIENSLVWVRQAESNSGDWVRLTGIIWESKVLGLTYAVFETAASTPVETSTWGSIKALYRN
jgi:hypothetical protein